MMKYEYVIGKNTEPSLDRPIIDRLDHRFKHLYIIGKPGMGKSTLMERLVQQDLNRGYPVIFIDPKGESVWKLYELNRDKHDIKYVSFKQPISINPLNKPGYSRDSIADEFAEIVNILTAEMTPNIDMTARMKTILHHLVKGLKSEHMTIGKVAELMHDKNKRDAYEFIDPNIQLWFKSLSDSKASGFDKFNKYIMTMASISDRLSYFIQNERASNFLQIENELNIGSLLENGQSLFVNTFDGSNDNKILLANLIVYEIISYLPHKQDSKPLFVYVDEFHLCASRAFSTALRLCRFKNIGFTMAHQDFEGIKPELLDAIISIVDNFVSFRVGDREAERLSRVFSVKPNELMNIEEYLCYFRTGNKDIKAITYPPIEFAVSEEQDLTIKYHFLGNAWI